MLDERRETTVGIDGRHAAFPTDGGLITFLGCSDKRGTNLLLKIPPVGPKVSTSDRPEDRVSPPRHRICAILLPVGTVVVTVVSLAAVLAAGLLLVRLRAAERPPARGSDDDRLARRLSETVRGAAAAVAGGTLAGFLVAGFGGRLLMRIIGATSDEAAAQRRLTEAGEVVGVVTGGGTAFFVFFGAGFGLLGGLGYFLFRPWLPKRSVAAGLVAAGIGGGILARPTDLLNPESVDFEILGPRWLAVLMILLLIIGLGVVGGVLIDTFTERWPSPAPTMKGIAGITPLVVLLGLGPGALIVAAVLAIKTTIRPGRIVAGRDLTGVATALLLAAGAAGWLWTLFAAAQAVA